MRPIIVTAAGNSENQDRGIILRDGPRLVFCVADGAGGLSGGLEAAILATEFVRQHAAAAESADACLEILRQLDAAIAKDVGGGETTCAIAVVQQEEVFGASVGDSGIWFIPEEGIQVDLTRGQQRKPFIGTGSAWPAPFRHPMQRGLLLLATDGLLKYAAAERIAETCRQIPIEAAAHRLVELVRYPSGALPDDVTLILTKL